MSNFSDVEDSRWSAYSIQKMVDFGLMGGFPDGTFGPAQAVTREQLAVVLTKMMFSNGVFEKGLVQEMLQSVVLVSRPDMALGSGYCVARVNGTSYIVTNKHVVGDFTTFTLVKEGGWPNASATLFAVDNLNDLAILMTSADLPPLAFDTQPFVGQPVGVIGAPRGYSESFTVGVLSNLNRGDGLMQLDAPINPGNSGGPVFNEYGQVLATVVSKFVATDVEGMAFCIRAANVIDFLQRKGIDPTVKEE